MLARFLSGMAYESTGQRRKCWSLYKGEYIQLPASCPSRVEAMYKERDAHWNVSLQQVAGEAASWQGVYASRLLRASTHCQQTGSRATTILPGIPLGWWRLHLTAKAHPPQFSFTQPIFCTLPNIVHDVRSPRMLISSTNTTRWPGVCDAGLLPVSIRQRHAHYIVLEPLWCVPNACSSHSLGEHLQAKPVSCRHISESRTRPRQSARNTKKSACKHHNAV